MEKEILRLLDEIDDYVKFLIYDRKLEISICDLKLPTACLQRLSVYTAHANPYCKAVKNKKDGQHYCLFMQKFVRRKCKADVPFFGNCYAGVSEFVFPLLEEGKYLGFICVGGYSNNAVLGKKSEFLRTDIPDMREIHALLSPLVNCFRLLSRYVKNERETGKARGRDRVYRKILRYVSENYLRKLTLEEIAEALHYSPSYLSHVFNEQNGEPLMKYLQTLKIEKAKELLLTTDLSILQISDRVGFEDSNYFTAVFKKRVGVSPGNYRNS